MADEPRTVTMDLPRDVIEAADRMLEEYRQSGRGPTTRAAVLRMALSVLRRQHVRSPRVERQRRTSHRW